MKLLAIVPALNEEAQIGPLVRTLSSYCDRVLVVDDGSSDRTAQTARAAGAEVLSHPQNRGKGAALQTAFGYAERENFEAAILLDGDGQHDPEEIPRFVEAQRAHQYDIVIGSRMGNTAAMPSKRKWTNRFMSWLISRMTHAHLTDTQSGYRLITAKVWQTVKLTSRHYEADTEMLIEACSASLSVGEVPVSTIYNDSESHIHKIADTYRFLRLICRMKCFRSQRGNHLDVQAREQ